MNVADKALDGENAPWVNRDVDAARETALERLFTSELRLEPNELQQRDLIALNDAALAFGTQIELSCPDGREKSVAWTHLEDALIRSRRAIFESML
jgi:phosphotransferase system HPr-like phosphotransfer protein